MTNPAEEKAELADDTGKITERLDAQAAALEDAQSTIAHQSTQLAELQERLDFTERMLAQSRDRSALGPGDKH